MLNSILCFLLCRRYSGTKALHKYLNPNLLAIAVQAIPGKTMSDSGLLIYLIGVILSFSLLIIFLDTVNGRIMHKIFEQGMTSPVRLFLTDNLLLVHAFSSKSARIYFPPLLILN